MLLQGIKVGNGAVIGANAVITSDVPAYAVVVGVPGEIIRFRCDDQDGLRKKRIKQEK